MRLGKSGKDKAGNAGKGPEHAGLTGHEKECDSILDVVGSP